MFLFAFGIYLGLDAYNTPQVDPAFADLTAKLRDVHFELNSITLGADPLDILNADAAILKDAFRQFPKATVILEGYCDDRGNDQYNFNLGYNRADAVRNALIVDKVDGAKLSVTSHGRKDSKCPTDDETCRGKNRRVHLTAIQN